MGEEAGAAAAAGRRGRGWRALAATTLSFRARAFFPALLQAAANVKIGDWFNYGLTENTWRSYARQQQRVR